MVSRDASFAVLGRRTECTVLDNVLAAVRQGHSAALVLRGEAGIGKTALLGHVVRSASGCTVLRVLGVESEMELPYAALQQLCAPILDHLDALPPPQRAALTTAFGLADGDPPDRFLVGLAVLTLLASAAARAPVVGVIDDAQWLDRVSAQTLGFVARRLAAESIALVFAVREPSVLEDLRGLDDLEVKGLADTDSHALLAATIPWPLDSQVRERIVAETHGNPLALLELPHGRSAVELAFGFPTAELMPLATRIEQDYEHRLQPLPPHTRRMLLIAAAEPVGDTLLQLRAADILGITADTAPAKSVGLIEPGEGIRFRHPLVRSAVYRSAEPEHRREVHRALADAIDRDTDPDRRAWHRAQACERPDEEVAAELEASAERAHRRGGIAAAAALLQRAATLTPDPARRGSRALAAAEAEYAAGASEATSEMLAEARLSPLDELQQARLARLEAQLMFARTRGSEAVPQFLEVARRLEGVDTRLARQAYFEAITAAIVAGRMDGPLGLRSVARAARAGPPGPRPSPAADVLLDGVAAWLSDGDGAFPALRSALVTFTEAPVDGRRATADWLRVGFVASQIWAHHLWDLEGWATLTERAVRLSREVGALSVLPAALMSLAGVHLHAGDLRAAARLITEGDGITAATRYAPVTYAALNLVAWRGDEDAAVRLLQRTVPDATERGETVVLGLAGYVTAVLYNGLGRYDRALAGARQVAEHDGFTFRGWALAELVEAAVRTGALDDARSACAELEEGTRASGSDWALGIQARCDALLSDGEDADRLYIDAITRLERSRVAVHAARAHLLYGEWLRRVQRRREGREHLRSAHATLSRMGVEAFADRARRELRATGETVRTRTARTDQKLTAQELQIAQLAAGGLTNPEIGARLFISPHTVEWHLRKVFAALGISSRRQLAGALPDAGTTLGAAP